MADDTAWKPPVDDDPSPSDAEGGPETPLLPTLPPAVVSPPPPPVPTSTWAPGGGSPAVSPRPLPTGSTPAAAMPPGFGSAPIFETKPVSTGGGGRRSNWMVASAVVAVLAVVAAGVFAITNLRASTTGGSQNPADLGTELLNAFENEDVLGVIDVLVPGEREVLGEPFVDLVSELQRLDVLSDTDLSDIAGLDIELSDEVVRTRATNVDDIINISLSADVLVSIDGAELPIGDLVTDNMPDDMLAELRGSRVTQSDELDLTLTAVLEDGRWYFSLLHTIAELARSDFSDEIGIPFEGVGFDGAESPEAAVDQILDRIEALDLTGIIRSLDPYEAAALQRYAPLFLEDSEAALAEVPLDWKITERSVRIVGSGDRRTALVDGLGVEGSFDGSPFSVSADGDCFTAEIDGNRIDQCADAGSISDVEDVFGDAPEVMHLIEVVQSAFVGVEPIGIELRSRNGEWFVSPVASFTGGMLKMLRALDRQELDSIIEAAKPAFESIADGFFGTTDGFFGTTDEFLGSGDFDLATPVDPGSTLDPVDQPVDQPIDQPVDQPGTPPVVDDFGWFDCYELEIGDATACFQSYEASGEIDVTEIPVVLRHAECGYAEASWAGANYRLPDGEFIAAAEAARGCFLDLVDSGQVEEWELPLEISQLECFEGRNWYLVFDDPEYDIRFDACRNSEVAG